MTIIRSLMIRMMMIMIRILKNTHDDDDKDNDDLMPVIRMTKISGFL